MGASNPYSWERERRLTKAAKYWPCSKCIQPIRSGDLYYRASDAEAICEACTERMGLRVSA